MTKLTDQPLRNALMNSEAWRIADLRRGKNAYSALNRQKSHSGPSGTGNANTEVDGSSARRIPGRQLATRAR